MDFAAYRSPRVRGVVDPAVANCTICHSTRDKQLATCIGVHVAH
jgi:hypothetical protein